MPLKLNIGLSKKIDMPDYGSLGASCHVEVELDRSLLEGSLDRFHQCARQAYAACSQAINDELARQHTAGNESPVRSPHESGHGHNGARDSSQSIGGQGSGATNGHRISEKQLNYARQLAGKINGLGVARLDQVAQRLYGRPLAELTSLEGSGLIDTLKSVKAGDVNLDDALPGAAA